MAESFAHLGEIILANDIDLLYVFGRADGQAIALGNDRLTAQVLDDWLIARNAEKGPGLPPVLFLNACPGGEPGNLLAAFERFGGSGLIGTLRPVAAPLANRLGLEVLTHVVHDGQSPAEALHAIRQGHPLAGLLYIGCCPQEPVELETQQLPLPEQPYHPLRPLGIDEAALLVGREFDTAQLAALVDDRAARLVLMHGAVGAGKASLLHAGLVPFLESQCVGFHCLRQRDDEQPAERERDYPVLSIRASSDLAGQLAMALLQFCSRGYGFTTPAGETVNVDLSSILSAVVDTEPDPDTLLPTTEDFRQALRADPALLSHVLAAVTADLPFELIVLIEHGEELLSLADPEDDEQDAFLELAMLRAAAAGPARVKFIMTLRTEFVGRMLKPLLQSPDDRAAVRTFLVEELTPDELVEVILQPTSQEPLPMTADVPQRIYGLQFEEGLADQIATDACRNGAANQESPLALVHVVCGRLYQLMAGQQEKVIRASRLKEIGGVERGLSRYVDMLVTTKMASAGSRPTRDLLRKLYERQPDGLVTRKLLFGSDLAAQWTDTAAFQETVSRAAADDVRLVEISYLNVEGKEGDFVSLAHDALAPVLASQAEDAARKKYGWSKFFDALWLTVPVIILAGVLLWTRGYLRVGSQEEKIADLEQGLKAQQEALLKNQRKFKAVIWPGYVGQLHAAEQALISGDPIRARQALIAFKPSHDDPTDDMRGLEWYLLWQKLHEDQLTVYGHRGTVTGAALTPDGLTLATVCSGGTVKVWNIAGARSGRRSN